MRFFHRIQNHQIPYALIVSALLIGCFFMTGCSYQKDTADIVYVSDPKDMQTKKALPTDCYITVAGHDSFSDERDPSYRIDDEGSLWSLGEDPVLLAENVIHVDYAPNAACLIYLTADHRLYGMGSNQSGILLDRQNDYEQSPERSWVFEPKLLMEHVIYAKCGREDIAAIDENGTLWNWGMVWSQGMDVGYFIAEPKAVLSDVVLVTGNYYCHAALKSDGTLWTWGYNDSGICALELGEGYIDIPTHVADDVSMVWGEPYNTLIRKTDGSFFACGRDIGTQRAASSSLESEVAEEDYHRCSTKFIPVRIAPIAQ